MEQTFFNQWPTDRAKDDALLPPLEEKWSRQSSWKEKKWLWRKDINREGKKNKATKTFSVQVSSSFSNRHGVTSASTQNQESITSMKGLTILTEHSKHTLQTCCKVSKLMWTVWAESEKIVATKKETSNFGVIKNRGVDDRRYNGTG